MATTFTARSKRCHASGSNSISSDFLETVFAMDMKSARLRVIVNSMLGRPDKESDEYYQALGRFVSAYAQVEGQLQTVLWKVSSLRKPIAQAVLSGVRTDDAIRRIYRIADAKAWPQKKRAEFKYVFDQVLVLNRFRNDVLHFGSELQEEGHWLSTNENFVHIPERIYSLVTTKRILDDARGDLEEIGYRLTLFFWKLPRELMKEVRTKVLSASWRYKPAPQSPKDRKTPPVPQKQRHPPRSFRRKPEPLAPKVPKS